MRPSRAPDPVPRLARAPRASVDRGARAPSRTRPPNARRRDEPPAPAPRAGGSNPRRRAPRDAADPRSIPVDQPARAPARPNARDAPHSAKIRTARRERSYHRFPPLSPSRPLSRAPRPPARLRAVRDAHGRARAASLSRLHERAPHASARAALDAALDAETGGGDAVRPRARLRVAAAKTRLDASRVRAAAFARTARLEREALDAIGARLVGGARTRADAARSAPPQSASRAPGARDGGARDLISGARRWRARGEGRKGEGGQVRDREARTCSPSP